MDKLPAYDLSYLVEKYREEEGGAFTHDGVKYDINCAFEIADVKPIRNIAVDKLKWILKYLPDSSDDLERTDKSDLTAPILIALSKNGKLAVIDGSHRLQKAVNQKVKYLPAKYLTVKELKRCKIGC